MRKTSITCYKCNGTELVKRTRILSDPINGRTSQVTLTCVPCDAIVQMAAYPA